MPEETGQFGQMVECSFTDQVALGLSPVAVSAHSIWLEGEHKHWRRRRTGNIRFIISYLWLSREKESSFKLFFLLFSFQNWESILESYIHFYPISLSVTLIATLEETIKEMVEWEMSGMIYAYHRHILRFCFRNLNYQGDSHQCTIVRVILINAMFPLFPNCFLPFPLVFPHVSPGVSTVSFGVSPDSPQCLPCFLF